MAAFFVPTRFVWRFGGRQVHLCGSFTRWVETIPMAPVEGTPGAFAVVVHLPPGYHQYKFIVDGKWMHDETAPYMPDPLGNVNNWLFVRRIEPPPQAPAAGITFEQQQQLLQQQLQQQQQQQQAQQQQQQQQQQQAAAAASAAAAAAALLQQQQGQQQQQQQQQQHQPAAAPPQQQATAAQQQQAAPAQQAAAAQQRAAAAVAALQAPRGQSITTAHALAGTALLAGAAARAASPLPGAATSGGAGGSDVEMAPADGGAVVAPIARSDREPDLTRKKVADFLHAHSAYELIPESGRAVLLDCDLPVRQAFHALHEQGCASAPVWDGREGTVVGVVSASDFILSLQRLRTVVAAGGNNPLSEAEMDVHTIRGMREAALLEGRPPKPLVFATPEDSLAKVVRALFASRCSMAPILSADPSGPEVPTVLGAATLGGVLATLMRHFRASLASLPLLAQPLWALPLGTWSEEAAAELAQLRAASSGGHAAAAAAASLLAASRRGVHVAAHAGPCGGAANGGAAAAVATTGGAPGVRPLRVVHPSTPLTAALGLLLEAGVSALPVVDDAGRLVDVYARADITHMCRGNAYSRLQWEDVTVGQALLLPPSAAGGWGPSTAASHPQALDGFTSPSGPPPGPKPHRVAVATRDEPLRAVVERLAVPGVRRLIVVQRGSGHVEGVVSLSDVAALLFM